MGLNKKSMKTSLKLSVIIILTFTFSMYPQTNNWISVGPEGGQVISIKAAPSNKNIVYSLINWACIFKSIDGGKSWNLLKWFPKGIQSFEIDPDLPDMVYAASDSIYVTKNGSKDWVNINCPAAAAGITSITVDPNNSEIIYVTSYTNNSSGLWRSEDQGKNWKLVPGMDLFRRIAVYPRSTNLVYAVSSGGNIFRSPDYGKSFEQIGKIDYYGTIIGLLLDPTDNKIIYVNAGNGIFKSSDEGVTWSLKNSGDINKDHPWTENIFVNPDNPAYLYRSGNNSLTYISTDYGETWKSTLLPSGSLTITADKTLLSGFIDGVYASDINCDNVHISSKGLNGTSINAIAVSSLEDDKILTIMEYQGYFKASLFTLSSQSTDWSKSYWGSGISQIKVSPFNPKFIVGGFNWGTNSINISKDRGVSWQPVIFDRYIYSVQFSSYDSAVIYAGGKSGLFKSTDKGNEWSQFIFPGYYPGYYHSVSDISCGDHDSTIFLCLDMGDDWARMHTLLSSQDMGKTWEQHRIEAISVLVVPDKHGLVLCGTSNPSAKLLRSTDLGNNWDTIKISGENIGVYTFEYYNKIIFAGTNRGVLYSEDYGLSWNKLGKDLPVENIGCMAVTASKTPVIYAGTIAGVYKYSFDILNSISNKEISNSEFRLYNNYPNPFNPITNITYSIPVDAKVVLRIYDLLGHEVSTLANKEQVAGEYEVQFDGSSLPSGVYIYTLQAGSYRDSKKLLLLK